ncbi:MAG TPA: PHP domain-containing protein [Clostridiaceae bacterium]|nr:PHP domain-containing protein [Clostridiaceae bacterium]
MFIIETHLHTKYISHCGWLTAEELLSDYAAAGYHGICVTDHYNRRCFDYAGIDLNTDESLTEAFLLGVRKMQELAADYGIRIYEGAELRFDENDNDYLLYGFNHDLLAHPDAVIKSGLADFYPRAQAAGALLIQAHPFRPGCSPAPAEYLDGLEVLNTNPRHQNNNDLALAYAIEHSLIQISGSDCHRPGDAAKTGIISSYLPADSREFAALLRSGEFDMIEEKA